MKKSLKTNYIYNMLYQVLIIILPIITMPYIARVLGANGVGTFSYVASITTYFILFGSLGISLYGQREIAYNQQNKEKRSKIFFELVVLRFITMLISILIFYLTFAINGQYSLYYKILLLELFANCIDISWFFQGIEEFKKITIRNLLVRLIGIIFTFSFVKKSEDLLIYIIIYVLSTFVSNFILWINVKKYISFKQIKKIKPFNHLKSVLILFIPQIAIQLYTVLDKIMIGYILNDMVEVGYYEMAQKVVKMLMTLLTSMATVMLPRIAYLFSKKDKKQIEIYMYKTFKFIFLLSIPMVLGICAVSNNFVPLFFGMEYSKVTILMCILSSILLFIGLSAVVGNQYLLTTKRQKEYTISVTLGACVNFMLNIILIKRYASIGAAISTMIAEFIVISIQLYFIRSDLKLNEILKCAKNYFISGIVMFLFCLAFEFIISNNLLCLLCQTSFGIVIYVIMLYLLKDDYFIGMLDGIKNLIKKIISLKK